MPTNILRSAQEKCLLLTSPFIEPVQRSARSREGYFVGIVSLDIQSSLSQTGVLGPDDSHSLSHLVLEHYVDLSQLGTAFFEAFEGGITIEVGNCDLKYTSVCRVKSPQHS